MLATGYFLKIAKIINSHQKKKQSVLIAKISSHKTQKMANPPAQTPAKILCHTVDILWKCFLTFICLFYFIQEQ